MATSSSTRRMIGRVEETSASFEARSAPRSYPTLRHPLLVLLCAAAKAARIDDKISTFDEPLPSQPIEEPRELGCRSRQLMQNAKPINSIRLLRPRRERPGGRRAAE
jgi:hypothetical protein